MISKTSPMKYATSLKSYAYFNGNESFDCLSYINQLSNPSCYYYVGYYPGTIEYENSGGKRMNYCLHVGERLTGPDHPLNGPHSCGSWGTSRYAVAGCSVTPYAPPNVTPDDIPSSARARAWNAIYPELNDGFSLSVFLFELTELPMLYTSIPQLAKLLKQALKGGVAADKPLSHGLLAYSFTYCPTFSDISSLLGLVTGAIAKINKFVDAGKKIRPYHYTEELSAGVVNDVASHYGFIRKITGKTTYNATAWITYDYDVDTFTSLRRLAGMRITAEDLWNVLPFSFVCDWVLKIGDFLSQFDKDPHVKVKIHSYCDSIKTTNSHAFYMSHSKVWQCDYRWKDYRVTWSDQNFDVPSWMWEKFHYLRVPTAPETGIALPAFDALSARELLLGGALLRA